jgi:hypothetical protein
MTRRYRATTFSIAVAGALAIAACSTDGGGATVFIVRRTLPFTRRHKIVPFHRPSTTRIIASPGTRQLPFSPHGRQERLEAFLSNGMDQQEADDKHHRAGYAMN